MVITVSQIDDWRNARSENQNLEFKKAERSFDSDKLHKYCVAIANEGGGYLILGVEDGLPRRVTGTTAFNDLVGLASKLFATLRFRVEVEEVTHPDGRVLVFCIPSRPLGTAYQIEGAYWMRSGADLVAMSEDRLRSIFFEGRPDWLSLPAASGMTPEDVIALLDTDSYFEFIKLPYPTDRSGVLDRLHHEQLIASEGGRWTITNLAALLFAKKLAAFSPELARKAPRFIVYEGSDKLHTKDDKVGLRGYAVGFEAMIDFVHSAAPQNRFIEEAIRKEVKMFPKQAIRELIANALVHQDFEMTGVSVVIEMYSDRLEISNPGLPPIRVERFIDEYRSRNERLATLMRRIGICEEKGSGIDKVIHASEMFQLPAPDFRASELRTTAVLFAHQEFPEMTKADRVRACYQHCCLQYLSGKRMSNQSLRERFGVDEKKVATVSAIITAAKEEGLIKPDDSESTSTRYARYLPFWA